MTDLSNVRDIKKEIDMLSEKIDDAIKANEKSKGAIETYLKQLKQEYDISSEDECLIFIEEGEKVLKKLLSKISKDYHRLMEIVDGVQL